MKTFDKTNTKSLELELQKSERECDKLIKEHRQNICYIYMFNISIYIPS